PGRTGTLRSAPAGEPGGSGGGPAGQPPAGLPIDSPLRTAREISGLVDPTSGESLSHSDDPDRTPGAGERAGPGAGSGCGAADGRPECLGRGNSPSPVRPGGRTARSLLASSRGRVQLRGDG